MINNTYERDPAFKRDPASDYSKHKRLHNNINFHEYQGSLPRRHRKNKVGFFAAKALTKKAISNFEEHNKIIEDAYRVNTMINYDAHSEASIEDKNRQAGLDLGVLINQGSFNFSGLIKEEASESATMFSNLNLVRKHAYDFVGSDDRKYVKKNIDSTIILGTSSHVSPRWYDSYIKETMGGHTIKTPSGLKLSLLDSDQSSIQGVSIEIYEFDQTERYYLPISRTTILEDDSATLQKYDATTAQFTAPIELNVTEIQDMYSKVIDGKDILG